MFLGCQEWPARFWGVQAVGNVVKILIQQRWESENKHPRKPLQNHRYADLWAKRPKEMACGRHIKDNKNGKQVNFSFSKIWWASKVSLLAIGNDCVVRSYRFSVPLTCTRAIIRQKVDWLWGLKHNWPMQQSPGPRFHCEVDQALCPRLRIEYYGRSVSQQKQDRGVYCIKIFFSHGALSSLLSSRKSQFAEEDNCLLVSYS